ncbi:hypothetical protein HN51_071340 [Arachis hypogaea]
MSAHEVRYKGNEEKLQKWKQALFEAANLSGWSFKNGYEYELIEKIAEEVSKKINQTPLHIAEYPVGLETRISEVKTLLQIGPGEDICVIGIYGLGGIGKTTIARALYNLIADQFEAASFLADIRESSNQRQGLVQLQESLLFDIVGDKNIKLGNIYKGIPIIRKRLCCKKVLLILDDVDKLEQLQALAGGRDWFGFGSVIIITTRDKHLLAAHQVDKTYEVKKLNHGEAFELFIWNAFKRKEPEAGYMEISNRVVLHAEGLPLALKVMGSNLIGKSVDEWTSALEKYEKIPNKEVQNVLRVTYDNLEENEKEIFLDIACFFKGETMEYVEKTLKACGFHPKFGIGVLIDRSLVSIDEYNRLRMHDLIQDMGREIVREDSPLEPGKRSRIWYHEDVIEVLTESTGTNNIEGIKLDLPEPDNINGKAFAKMKRLRILVINNALVTDEIQYLSDELRLIDWPGYPSSTLPPNFHPRRLVSLNMSHSHIKHLWKGAKIFRDLKLVSFSCCEHLTEIPDMSMVPNLESLSIDNCKSLIRVHESVGTLNKLVTLNLMFCSNLNTLPTRFKLKSLRNLLLTGCSKLRKFPEIVENMEHLEEILLQGTAIKELPQSIEYLVGLKSLFLDSCQNLEHLPSSIQKLQYLTTLNLSYCSKLQELPKLPPNTKYLDISDCRSLESFTMLSSPSNVIAEDLSSFQQMSFINCHKLINEQVQFHLTNLFYNEVGA